MRDLNAVWEMPAIADAGKATSCVVVNPCSVAVVSALSPVAVRFATCLALKLLIWATLKDPKVLAFIWASWPPLSPPSCAALSPLNCPDVNAAISVELSASNCVVVRPLNWVELKAPKAVAFMTPTCDGIRLLSWPAVKELITAAGRLLNCEPLSTPTCADVNPAI